MKNFHGITIRPYIKVHTSLRSQVSPVAVTFKADMEGVFPYYCTEFCSALHLEMMGYLLVKDPDKKYESAKKLKMAKMSKEELEKEYKQIVATNDATDKVIQSVVKFLKENHYEKYPVVNSL